MAEIQALMNIMQQFGDSPMVTPTTILYYTYNLTTLCLNGTLSCENLMNIIMGDIANFWCWINQSISYQKIK